MIRVLYVAGGRLFCGRSLFGVAGVGMIPRCLQYLPTLSHQLGWKVGDYFRRITINGDCFD